MSTIEARTTTTPELETTLNKLCEKAQAVCVLSKTASRNGKSLHGDNFYADKFHAAVLAISKLEAEFVRVAEPSLDAASFDEFTDLMSCLKDAHFTWKARTEAVRNLRLLCQTRLLPLARSIFANSVPRSEQILPMDLVKGTRGYLEGFIRQANGCYEHQWYDACAVMIRKFIETLIIEVYEAHSLADEIKDTRGEFQMLRDLIDKVLTATSWNLGRETKQSLPPIKNLGDRSAHTRRYLARKQDVDGIRPGLRVIAEELLHLAKLR